MTVPGWILLVNLAICGELAALVFYWKKPRRP